MRLEFAIVAGPSFTGRYMGWESTGSAR